MVIVTVVYVVCGLLFLFLFGVGVAAAFVGVVGVAWCV